MNFDPVLVLSVVLDFAIVLLSLSVHESAHAWAADRLGDPTARMLGRVTLNPLPHIDIVGTIMLPILLAVSGLPVFGWAKPVPVISRNFRKIKRDQALVAAAGPASNFVLALLGTLALSIYMAVIGPRDFFSGLAKADSPVRLTLSFSQINLALAAFNLIPLPPLDGSWVLGAILPGTLQPFFESLRRVGPIVLLVLFFTKAINFLLFPILMLLQKIAVEIPLGLIANLIGG